MGKFEVSALSSASPATVYDLLEESGVISGLRVVGSIPNERMDLRGPSRRFLLDYFGRIDLMGLPDGGTLIRWRVVFRARFAGTRRLVGWGLRGSTSGLARRLARFTDARDYDAPPY